MRRFRFALLLTFACLPMTGVRAHDAMNLDQLMQSFGWDFASAQIKTQKITDHLHVLFGLGGNIAVSTGTNGVLVVDDQFPQMMPKILAAIGELAERHDLWVLCDEVWEGMVFDGTPHVSPLAIPTLASRAIKIGSAGKIFSMTGWKVGWAVAAPPLAAAVAAKHQFLTFTTATPLQWAVAEALALPPAWHSAHRARYAAAKARLVGGLASAGFAVLPASGTWFVTVDLAASGLPADDAAVAERLIREAGVASIPVSAFYAEQPERGFLRLCFAKEDATLDEALERLSRFRRSA